SHQIGAVLDLPRQIVNKGFELRVGHERMILAVPPRPQGARCVWRDNDGLRRLGYKLFRWRGSGADPGHQHSEQAEAAAKMHSRILIGVGSCRMPAGRKTYPI